MAKARAMANDQNPLAGSVAAAAAPVPMAVEEAAAQAAPEPEPPAEPPSEEEIGARLAAVHCVWSGEEDERKQLTGTADTDVEAVHQLLKDMGVNACTLFMPQRVYVFKRSRFGDRRLNCTSQHPMALVSEPSDSEFDEEEPAAPPEEWTVLEGGPWTAKLMRPAKQPGVHALYRNFQVAIPFDPIETPLVPGMVIRFEGVPGGPEEGILCAVPVFSGNAQALVFKLKLTKAGAPGGNVTIQSAAYQTHRFAPAADKAA